MMTLDATTIDAAYGSRKLERCLIMTHMDSSKYQLCPQIFMKLGQGALIHVFSLWINFGCKDIRGGIEG